jgi:asparagine synthase (glutamine-hydrolysing)
MLAKKKLPKDIVEHPKQGFSIPAARWLRGELKEMAYEAIFGNRVVAGYLQPSEVRRIWDEHQSGNRDHNVFLWGLMMLGLWEELNSKSLN